MTTGPAAYEQNWVSILSHIEGLKAGGETQLSRVVRLTERSWRANIGREGVAFGKAIEAPPAVLVGGRQAHRTGVVLDACRDDTDLVVELGSGWGNNLADIYLAGGPRGAAYWALEPTISGRACASHLAGCEPLWRLKAAPLDLYSPDYSVLAGSPAARHAVVMTSHAIEQIDVLPRAAITELLGIADSVTGIHFEPIGWQMPRDSEIGATEAYSRKHRYNTNLWPLLCSLQADGLISIDEVAIDVFHQKRANVSTLVVWRKN